MSIDKAIRDILIALAGNRQFAGDSSKGRYMVEGPSLSSMTGLDANQINDAVELLVRTGDAIIMKALGTHPFTFQFVQLTPRGRLTAEEIVSDDHLEEEPSSDTDVAESVLELITIAPVGSPFGFTDTDWEYVQRDKKLSQVLIVSLGMQWNTDYYNPDVLASKIEDCFRNALNEVNPEVTLDFRKLHGAYGEHLFNLIARDIISSDIAVFEISDGNRNVMIEMGVALTYGVKVFPIRCTDSPVPPSDISGQTWIEYSVNYTSWTDPDHHIKLCDLIRKVLHEKTPFSDCKGEETTLCERVREYLIDRDRGDGSHVTGNVEEIASAIGTTEHEVRKCISDLHKEGLLGQPYFEGNGDYALLVYRGSR